MRPEICEKNGKLVPVIELKTLEQYIQEPFGNGQFKIARSINRDTFILQYRSTTSGKILGTAELTSFVNEAKERFILLYSSNISGTREAFISLFQDIAGKMIPASCQEELPLFILFDKDFGKKIDSNSMTDD